MRVVKTYDDKILAGIPPGTWVGISHDQERVVATGRSIDAVLRKAKKAGEKKQPYIMRIPLTNSALIL